MLRSRANTIEGGTSEVNKNVLGERAGPAPRPRPVPHDAVAGHPPLMTGYSSHATLDVHREGHVGWLVPDRPDRNAMDAVMLAELGDGVARVRRRRRGAGHRHHRQRARVPDRLDVAQLAADPAALREQSRRTRRAELRLTAWHNQVEAGRRGGQRRRCAGGLHFVADADIVIAGSDATLDPHVSVGQVTGMRRSPWCAPRPWSRSCGWRWSAATSVSRPSGPASSASCPRWSTRPGGCASGPTSWPLTATARRPWRPLSLALWGAPRWVATEACRRGARELVGLWGHPDSDGRARRLDRQEGAAVGSYEHLIVERLRLVGWLVNDRPDQLNAMNARMRDEFADARRELDDDLDVRAIVHTGNGWAFQTGVDVAEIAGDGVGMERYRQSMEDFDLHFTAWHQQVAAGDHRGQRHPRRGRVPLGGRRRHRHLRRRRPVLRSLRVDRAGGVGRGHRPDAQDAGRGRHAHGVRGPPRADGVSAGLRPGAWSARWSTRRSGRGERAQELGETAARNSLAALAATKRALWGALEVGLTEACRRGAHELVSLWGHPDQTEGPAVPAERREPRWQA